VPTLISRTFLQVTIAALLLLVLLAAVPATGQTTQPADPILAAYLRLYGGDADEAYRQFEALRTREAHSLAAWFGVLFALHSRVEVDDSLAPAFERDIAAFIEHAELRHSRSRTDWEAVFYLAQSYLLRSTYRLNYDKGVWGAARDAAKSKSYGDQYVRQFPDHGDAYLTLGLYNYYVDIAPNFVKVLRVLLLLPSGNRAEGLKQLERVARQGTLFAPLAEGALADIYGTLEGRLAEAIPIAERFVRRFPANADIRIELAQFYSHPTVEAYERAQQQYTAVMEAAKTSSHRDVYNRNRATMGMASLRRSQWRLEEAVSLLATVIDQQIQKPIWMQPNALLQRANYRMLLNDTAAADDARRVLDDSRLSNWHKQAQQQIAAIEARRKTDEGAIYATLVPGNRLVVEDRWIEAKAVYDKVAAARPGDWQVRYRLAYLDFARGNYAAAAPAFDAIASTTARIPNWLRAAAMLNLAWIHDIGGRREEALKLYKRIVDSFENEAALGAARLGLIAPYRGPIQIS
jgi:tetratricopeptide (TPR) repeat protein